MRGGGGETGGRLHGPNSSSSEMIRGKEKKRGEGKGRAGQRRAEKGGVGQFRAGEGRAGKNRAE